MFNDVSRSIVEQHHENGDFDGFQLELFRRLFVESPVTEEEFRKLKSEEVADRLYEAAMSGYERHSAQMARQALPVISDVYLNQGAKYENIVVPITDGIKTMQVVANLEKTYKTEGRELGDSIERYITLAIIDNEWKEHLREMDELRRSVQNAAIEQKDPLLIYKLESFNLFQAMIDRVNGEVVTFLSRAGLPAAEAAVQQAQPPRQEPQQKLQTSRTEVPQFAGGQASAPAQRPAAPAGAGAPNRGPMPPQGPPRPPAQPVRVEKKVGRNDPCPCGSGKKFKQCHGVDA
jgi:preprotein translocase subunit SecA